MESAIVNFTAERLDLSYVSDFYSKTVSDEIYHELLNYDFQNITFNIGDRQFTPNRKVCVFGERGLTYSFSGASLEAKGWTERILSLKSDVEKLTKTQYNFVILNYYPDGFSKISPHCDAENSLERQSPIATLSFGATRKMIFSRKNYDSQSIDLTSGSMLVMHPPTNQWWKHGIPQQADVTCGRISLTFRALSSIVPDVEPASKKRRLDNHRRYPLPPLEKDPKNTVVCEKDVGLFAKIEVVHTRSGLYVGMRSITGTDNDYSNAVFISASTWLEFESKFHHFNIRYKDSSFMCSDQLLVCWKGETCVIQQLAWAFSGFKAQDICIELIHDEVDLLREAIPEVTHVLLQKLFCLSLPHFISEYKNYYKPEGVPVPINENEAKFWNCISQAIANCCEQYYHCEGCKVSDPAQMHHSCFFLSSNEKFAIVGKYALLGLKLFDLCRDICKNVNIDHLSENFLNMLTVEKCIEMFESDLKSADVF